MRPSTCALSMFFLAISSTESFAQDLQCPDLAKTLREHSIESSSSSYLNAVFIQHCQQDGTVKTGSTGIGIEAAVNAIPAKFTGSKTSAESAMSNFCKTYASTTSSSSDYDSYKQTISLRSLETIQQCLRLQASGVLVTHKIANAESADFFLRAQPAINLQLRGIHITGDTTRCTGQINGTSTQFGVSTSIKVKDAQSFACKRTAKPLSTGSLYFPETVITVMTNHDNYVLFWPKGERVSEDMAEEIDQRVKKVESDLATTINNVSPLVRASDITIYKCPTGTGGVSKNAPWMTIGCNGQISSESTCENIWYGQAAQVRQCEKLGNTRVIK